MDYLEKGDADLDVTTRVVLFIPIPHTSFQSGCGISISITHAKVVFRDLLCIKNNQ